MLLLFVVVVVVVAVVVVVFVVACYLSLQLLIRARVFDLHLSESARARVLHLCCTPSISSLNTSISYLFINF